MTHHHIPAGAIQLPVGPGKRPAVDEDLAFGLITALSILALVHSLFLFDSSLGILRGGLVDTDPYLRLVRVRELWHSGNWFDPTILRASPPDGFTPHWTRLLDALLLGGALVLAPFTGFDAGLHWWGVAIGPVLQVAAIFSLVWAASPFLDRKAVGLLPILFVCQPAIFAAFEVGRPDHHGLLLLLFILSFGSCLRQVARPDAAAPAMLGGVVTALGLWVSVEVLVLLALVQASFGVRWLVRREGARSGAINALALLVTLALALLAERGWQGALTIEVDRLSVVHLLVAALVAGMWLAVAAADRLPSADRFAVRLGTGLAAAAAAALVLAASHLPLMPTAALDPLYRERHFFFTSEILPAVRFPPFDWEKTFARPVGLLGFLLVAGPALVALLRRKEGADRLVWLAVLWFCVAHVVLAFRQVRWSEYAEALLLFPYAVALSAACLWLDRNLRERHVALARALLVVTAAVWTYLPHLVVKGEDASAAKACPAMTLDEALADPATLGASPKRIMAFADYGPGILYHTPHQVFSLPMHRHHSGYETTFRALSATDWGAAERRLRDAGVDVVVVCNLAAEKRFYSPDGEGRSLWQALAAGEPPPFLRPLSVPALEGSAFRLYAVAGGNY